MDERHAAETAALEQRERDAAGPQEESTNILATDLYSFSLPPSETQKQVRHTRCNLPVQPCSLCVLSESAPMHCPVTRACTIGSTSQTLSNSCQCNAPLVISMSVSSFNTFAGSEITNLSLKHLRL